MSRSLLLHCGHSLQTREQPAATSSAWGHASRILWDRFDREISSSAAARGTIRQQPDVSPQLKAHISEFINQAGALSGPEQLQRCLGHIQGLQASGAQLPLEVMQAVTSSCREDGQWLLVECGEWVQYKDWSGPARAFLQVQCSCGVGGGGKGLQSGVTKAHFCSESNCSMWQTWHYWGMAQPATWVASSRIAGRQFGM